MDLRTRNFFGQGQGRALAPVLLAVFALVLFALAVFAMAGPVRAQSTPDGLSFTTVDPPRGESAAAYGAAVAGRAQTEATYASDIHGGRLMADSRAPRREEAPSAIRPPVLDGGWAMIAVVSGLALVLFLWLRFGGGGLMARAPAAGTAPVQVPDGWDMAGAGEGPGGADLLAQIAAMPDRRAAMVRLLRHCLLQAAAATGTRLARSDTERRALARLPDSFRLRAGLEDLLRRAELAHYGGRPVAEADFADSLTTARALLQGGGHA